ncbi:XdhC/CoxI family protein [Pseudolysobacter antarcticus]|uniref:XdhC/CoxI family protein n=1 Tax=Pseudolysobacter antarcticus TaxID=2511995 RepID=A0A411HEU8_9GAMM|nr:XdhC/CoxI family protein [Pseudolysobacter antarcticus]QBB69013.1 XdhC/CoxI family protein [Pseudolysobacter antarcticus]
MFSADPNLNLTSICGGNRGLIERALALQAQGQNLVLAIVTATEGSTYQKPGALVLLDAGGVRAGVISGGCLEPELELKAREVLIEKRAQLAEFNTESDDDLVFGSGIGCRGRMWVLLLPQSARSTAPLLQALVAAQQAGLVLTIELDVSGDIGAGRAQTTTQHWTWNSAGANSPTHDAIDPLEISTTAARLFIAATSRVLLLGAGPETPSLIACARQMGWQSWVVEHRGRWSQLAHRAAADHVIELAPMAAHAQLQATRFDAALVMSHNFSTDLAHLRSLAQSDIAYIGLLGPPARRDELLAELGDDAALLHPRLHAPVGLPLGGQGPEAIALSIAAELQQHFARYAQRVKNHD